MNYAIRFDLGPGFNYAGMHKGAAGFAHTLETAKLFDHKEDAERFLANMYGRMGSCGEVVKVNRSASGATD